MLLIVNRMRKHKKKNIAFLALITIITVFSSIIVSGLLTTAKTLNSSGSIKAVNVEIYWDQSCTNAVTNIDWGMADAGNSISVILYVKNNGNSPLSLSMSTNSWIPGEASSYISLSWNRAGTVLDPQQVVQAQLTLDISDSITGITDYNFNILIEGTG